MQRSAESYVHGIYDSALRYFAMPSAEPNLFHYTSFSAIESIVKGNSLHASNVHFMNDPTELLYPQQLLQDTIDYQRYNLNKSGRYFPSVYFEDHVMRKIRERDIRHFVLSFTFELDSAYLWRAYGDRDGYALVFKIADIIAALQSKDLKLRTSKDFDYASFSIFHGRVLYDELRQRRLLNFLIKRILPLIEVEMTNTERGSHDLALSEAVVHATCILYACIYNLKPATYSEENEYRIVLMPDPDFANIRRKVRNSREVPYIEIGGAKLPFFQILIGPNNVDDADKEISQLLNSAARDDVSIIRSKLLKTNP